MDPSPSSPQTLSDYVPTWFILAAFVAIMALSVSGNLPVALSLLKSRRMKGVTSVFVMSLVVSSMLVGIGVTALAMVQTVWPTLMVGSACQIPTYVEMTCVTASIYSLVSVSIDRYVAVIHPTSRSLNLRTAGAILTMVWLGALVYSSRWPIQSSLKSAQEETPPTSTSRNATIAQESADGAEEENETAEGLICNFFVEESEEDLPYRLMDLVLLFLTPFLAMACMYVRISRKLWMPGQPISTMLHRKRRVVKMLIVTILFFFCCWVPFYMVDVASDSLKIFLGEEAEERIESNPVYLISRCLFIILALSNSFITPFIYIFYNEAVREDTRRFFLSLFSFLPFSRCSRQETPPGEDSRIIKTVTSNQQISGSSGDDTGCDSARWRHIFGGERSGNKVLPWKVASAKVAQPPPDVGSKGMSMKSSSLKVVHRSYDVDCDDDAQVLKDSGVWLGPQLTLKDSQGTASTSTSL